MIRIFQNIALIADAVGAMLRSGSPGTKAAPPTPATPATPARSATSATTPQGRRPQVLLVPVRALRPRHRAAVLAHLLELAPADRYLRFGYAAQDAQIQRYVQGLDFKRDQIFGIFNRRLRLIAVAHLAYARDSQFGRCAEFGVSVSPSYRGRGLGAKLFARAQLHAQNDRISQLYIHALSENSAMLKIARNAGATVQRLGSESDAYLELPLPTLQSHMSEAVDVQIADTDYRFKVQAQQFWGVLAGVRALRQRLRRWCGGAVR